MLSGILQQYKFLSSWIPAMEGGRRHFSGESVPNAENMVLNYVITTVFLKWCTWLMSHSSQVSLLSFHQTHPETSAKNKCKLNSIGQGSSQEYGLSEQLCTLTCSSIVLQSVTCSPSNHHDDNKCIVTLLCMTNKIITSYILPSEPQIPYRNSVI